MGFTRRYDASSDVDETFEPSRRSRKRPRRTHSLPPSSPPPQSPGPLPDPTDEDHSGSDDDVATPPRAPLPNLLSTFQHPSHPSSSTAATPRPIPGPRSFLRAESLEPRPSSPMGDVPDETPIPTPLPSTSTRRGRPKYSPETQRLSKELSRLQRHKTSPSKRQYRDIWEKREARKESAREQLQKAKKWEELERKKARKAKMVEKEREHKEAVKVAEAAETLRAQQLIELALKPQEEGGFGFEGLDSFFTAVFRKGGDAVISRKISQYVAAHGSEHAKSMFARSETARDEYFTDVLREKLKKEGRAIQKLLTRDETTTVQELLKQFSMEKLMDEIRDAAPTIWEALEIVSMPDHATRRPSAGETRRDKGLVFTTICALVAVLRSQKANNFQLVVGLFLLGSGAAKREISVLAHAGISISYASILEHVKKLSSEGLGRIREVVASSMCQVVWDNLNIAFRIAEQRLNAKNHFDNGTTGSVLPVYDPETGKNAVHGTLPLSMKPARERALPVLEWTQADTLPSPKAAAELTANCLWQIKRLALAHLPNLTDDFKKTALGDCPVVDQIPLHKTEQYPLPAMKIDESSLEGTLEVYNSILRVLGLDDEGLKKHGILFDDGDLLTDSLKEKLESARRNSTGIVDGMHASVRRFGLFHAQMAGCRLVVNEHWGKPNSLYPGGLWWEHNTLLKRKPLKAGWGQPKATEWKPGHELLHISLPAHILDAFRIHCGHDDLATWTAQLTIDDFDTVAKRVQEELFSTAALTEARDRPVSDTVFENNVLYNRDAIVYIEFVHAIKRGDIGRVLNVLSVWMVMMRTPKTMPRYADVFFETLVRLRQFEPKLRQLFLANWLVNLTGRFDGFKPVDLLQEHQNMWAKTIYNAKGVNKSWDWLGMITVCIFDLRSAIRTVGVAFKIPGFGIKHSTPPIDDEVARLAAALQVNGIQRYNDNRPGQGHVTAIRDLIEEGATKSNTSDAFARFTHDKRKPQKTGLPVDGMGEGEEDEGPDEGAQEEYEPTREDLAMDSEEPFDMQDDVLAAAMRMAEDILDN